MATFWERAAHFVNSMFSLYCTYLQFWLFPILVLRTGSLDTGHCLPFTFELIQMFL